jgi:phage-related protein
MNLYFNTYRNPFRLDPTLAGLYPTGDDDFPIRFAYGSRFDYKPLIDQINFGDGYAQRSAAGIQKQAMRIQLVFDKRRNAVAKALRRFFMGDLTSTLYNRSPAEYFYLAVPDPLEDDISRSTPRKFVVDESVGLSIVPVEYDTCNITVSINEWFGQ